jgi:hypothetical protein
MVWELIKIKAGKNAQVNTVKAILSQGGSTSLSGTEESM